MSTPSLFAWSRVAAIAAALLGGAAPASAQLLDKLPQVHDVYLMGSSGVSAAHSEFGVQPLYGFGIEIAFHVGYLGADEDWTTELAIGYQQLSGYSETETVTAAGATISRELRGSLRTLPSSTLYLSHESGVYFGLHLGRVALDSFRGYEQPDDDSSPLVTAISGTTWEAGGSIGYATDAGVSLDLGYRFLRFPSIEVGSSEGLSASFPRSLDLSAVLVTLSYRLEWNQAKPRKRDLRHKVWNRATRLERWLEDDTRPGASAIRARYERLWSRCQLSRDDWDYDELSLEHNECLKLLDLLEADYHKLP